MIGPLVKTKPEDTRVYHALREGRHATVLAISSSRCTSLVVPACFSDKSGDFSGAGRASLS